MVQITTLAVALVAAASSASAFDRACPFPNVLCGYTLNNGVYGKSTRSTSSTNDTLVVSSGTAADLTCLGYTRPELIAALRRAGIDPNIPGVIEHSLFNCTDNTGGIATTRAQFCGNAKCVEPNPGNPEAPGPNAVCKP